MNPKRTLTLSVSAVLALCAASFAAPPALKDLRSASPAVLEQAGFARGENPVPPGTGRSVEIALYETEEEFTFDSGAQEAMDLRLEAFRRAGIKTLGGRVTRKPNRKYAFAIEYFPALEPGTPAPAAVVAGTYKSPSAYWRERDAAAALAAVSARFTQAGVSVLGGAVVDVGNDSAFEIDYLMPDASPRGRADRVRIERYRGGRFTFESRAEAALAEYSSRFEHAGTPVLHARAVRRPDRDYSVEVEYAVRAGARGARPEFALARYDGRETFPFENRALAAGEALLPAFSTEGAAGLHAFARPVGSDYSFSVEYLVRTLYRRGRAEPAVTVRAYRSVETFTFEREAEAALETKKAAFRAVGISVLGGRVVESGRDYAYELDYFDPAGRLPL